MLGMTAWSWLMVPLHLSEFLIALMQRNGFWNHCYGHAQGDAVLLLHTGCRGSVDHIQVSGTEFENSILKASRPNLSE
jgi:hypothetical protein